MTWEITISRNDTGATVKTLGSNQDKLNTAEILEMVFYMELLKKNLLEVFMRVQPVRPASEAKEEGNSHA